MAVSAQERQAKRIGKGAQTEDALVAAAEGTLPGRADTEPGAALEDLGLHRGEPAGSAAQRAGDEERGQRARGIFRLWLLIFAVVGAQMAFILRPFVGNPQIQFTWFRVRWSNVFEFLARSFTDNWH